MIYYTKIFWHSVCNFLAAFCKSKIQHLLKSIKSRLWEKFVDHYTVQYGEWLRMANYLAYSQLTLVDLMLLLLPFNIFSEVQHTYMNIVQCSRSWAYGESAFKLRLTLEIRGGILDRSVHYIGKMCKSEYPKWKRSEKTCYKYEGICQDFKLVHSITISIFFVRSCSVH
jgi:hypothetical protein